MDIELSKYPSLSADKCMTNERYRISMKRLFDKGLVLDKTITVRRIMKTIRSMGNNNNGSVVYYLVVVKHYLDKNNIRTDLIPGIASNIKRLNNLINKRREKHELTENQKPNYITKKDITDVHKKLKRIHLESYNGWTNYVIISMYVHFPPRRLLDYQDMWITDNVDSAGVVREKKNFYTKNDGYFIFRNYKTSTVYGEKKFKVPKNLKTIIDQYIKNYCLIGKLFDMSRSTYRKRIVDIFKMHHNKDKNISVNIIRHAFITDKANNGDIRLIGQDTGIGKSQKKYAEKMGHSTGTQSLYYVDETSNHK